MGGYPAMGGIERDLSRFIERNLELAGLGGEKIGIGIERRNEV